MTPLSSIKELAQEHLKANGFYHGAIDGIWGPISQKAEQDYRSSRAKVSDFAKRLVELALAEVGVREEPKNSNTGPRIREYQSATWLEGTGWPYCAAFICWLCKEAGMPDSKRPKTAGAWDFERYAKKMGATLIKPASKTQVLEGDIVIFTFSHIGLAVANEADGLVPTVEANTDESGSREGGGNYRKIRKKSLIRSIIRFS